MSLTGREEKFCQEYVKKLDKTKAAIAAGYSKKTARQIGYQNFTKVHITDRIREIQEELREKSGITEHAILTELAALAFWDIGDFIKEGNTIQDLTKMTKPKRKPVIGMKVTERFLEDGTRQITTELKMADKRGALVDLGRHLGVFEKDNEQQSIKISIKRK
ncbi:terminase small subunit [Danxiaibacter flavus]|uniref:Terminase small subunit n=1 Tax=Danxiaibacter flavus TaxID=3049108 RepID=A0ABV3ZL77_9BACT|nr:terminase small subunit [Chitinophagaceae bacterium DXS]